MNKLIILKGPSGVGKSSRVEKLLNQNNSKEIFITLRDKSSMCLGFLIKELNLFIFGKYNSKNKFVGMDYINSKTGSSNLSYSFIEKIVKKYNVLIEGEPLMISHRYRPTFIFKNLNVNSIMIKFFLYNSKSEYLNRIKERSGKHPKKDTGWNRNKQYFSDYNSTLKEVNEKVVVYKELFNEPIQKTIEQIKQFLKQEV
jgi:guanylate kinase